MGPEALICLGHYFNAIGDRARMLDCYRIVGPDYPDYANLQLKIADTALNLPDENEQQLKDLLTPEKISF